MGFKEDAQFARYVTMGAVGTAAVAHDLRTRFGHRPIELERYSMANKVWAVKVKRLRIPDLVCVNCGLRVESRGKTKLEVKLSDSATPGREWSGGGMRDDDLFAFVRIEEHGHTTAVGEPGYFTREALRQAVRHARRGARKAASEGSEVDLAWPTWVPTMDGTLLGLENDEVLYEHEGRQKRYWRSREWPQRHLYLPPGATFMAGSTIVAGIVEPPARLACPGGGWNLAASLRSEDTADRYAAIKAAGARGGANVTAKLRQIALRDADWRVQLEAMASLARRDPAHWVASIHAVAADVERDPAEQFEAILILSEIPARAAVGLLADVAQQASGRDPEIRAAAVWGLGTGASPSPERALEFATDLEDRVALHAAAAIQRLTPAVVKTLRRWLHSRDDRAAAVAAGILAHHRCVDALVRAAAADGDSRLWALQALGELPPGEVRRRARGRLTSEMEEALAPLWLRHQDWLRTPENEGAMSLLAQQQVRFEPMEL